LFKLKNHLPFDLCHLPFEMFWVLLPAKCPLIRRTSAVAGRVRGQRGYEKSEFKWQMANGKIQMVCNLPFVQIEKPFAI
jgi:hypothetical protein